MLRTAVLLATLTLLPLGARAQQESGPETTAPEGFQETPEAAPQPEAAAEPEPVAGASDPALDAIDRGLGAYWRRDWAGAAAEFQAALDADPQSAAAAFYLGYAIYKQHEFRPFHPEKERAKELFARAFELDPTFSPTFQRSGR